MPTNQRYTRYTAHKMVRNAKRSTASKFYKRIGWHDTTVLKCKQICRLNTVSAFGGGASYSAVSSRITPTVIPGTECFFTMNFTLNDVAQVTTFQSLYDQYMIHKVKLKIFPVYQSPDLTGGAVSAPSQRILTLVDHDDSLNPGTCDAMRQYGSCKEIMVNPNKCLKIDVTPHVAVALYSGAFTSYGNKSHQWIDTNSPNVNHFGFKLGLPGNAAGAVTYQYEIIATYYLEFKNMR